MVVNEYKGKWSLDPTWFVNGRIEESPNSHVQAHIAQLYNYMVVNHLQYGILSSWDYNFFFKREKSIENSNDVSETLFISSGIPYQSTFPNPTVLQSVAYLLSIADGSKFLSPPSTLLRTSPRISKSSSDHPLPTAKSSNANIISAPPSLGHAGSNQGENSARESEFFLEDFKIDSTLGIGRSKVYYEANNNLALKSIDLWKQSHLLHELKNEILIYGLLSDLQEISIPKLVLHGFFEGFMYVIGFTQCGTVPKKLSESQKHSILSTLDIIHDRGILHNDIKKENILVDEKGKVYLINFGFATQDASMHAQEDERNQLLNCIECL